MHHLTLEQMAELREDLLSMRNRLTKQAEEHIMNSSDANFQGGDEIDSQRIRARELKLLLTTMCINCKELAEEGENE